MSPTPSKPIALITGASRGLGKAAALALAKQGFHIIAVARTIGGLEELDDAISQHHQNSTTLVQMDMRDRLAMINLANAITERWGRLDAMIANAGVLGVLTPVSHLDGDIWDEVIDTNLSSAWRMIHAFDDLLKASPHGRAVLVTSAASNAENRPFWSAYSASKAGLEALGQSWAAEAKSTSLKVNMLDPGDVATSMFSAAFPGADLKAMPIPDDIAPAFVALTSKDCPYHGQILKAGDLI